MTLETYSLPDLAYDCLERLHALHAQGTVPLLVFDASK